MSRILTREEWRRRRRRRRIILYIVAGMLFLVILAISVQIINKMFYAGKGGGNAGFIDEIKDKIMGYNNEGIEAIDETLSNGVTIQEGYLTPNEYSRPQIPLKGINAIVIHYTANPGTSAQNNRSYFESLAEKHTTSASSHYIIGLEGEVIQCIPLTEIAYASNDRNFDTVAVECCHPDETGKFNDATYNSLVSLTAALCVRFDLEEEDIIRHYDITEKLCPLYFVEHEDAWRQFRADVMAEAENIGASQDNQE